MPIALIIPALDEETAIGGLLSEVDRDVVGVILVGDNGSRDQTREVARGEGATVVEVPQRGYGAACAGALELLPAETTIVVFMDADGSDVPGEISALIAPIERDEADLVIGSRTLGTPDTGALSPQQRFGNWLAVRLIARIYGHRYTDLGPFRAIRRDLLDRIDMQDRGFGWTVEMQVRALQLGGRVIEIPVRYRRRRGRSKISGTVRGVVSAGWGILSTIFKYAR